MIVETRNGPVAGLARDGVVHWRGIPYAAQPRRFAPPEPPIAWTEVRDATKFGPAAIQSRDPRVAMMSGLTDRSVTSEDCLSINVTSPSPQGSRPVLAFVHGGAFIMGTTATPLYNGTSFATTHDLVVVTFNYRLGILGLAGGNWALLDQIAALAWIRDNIAAFGGDPHNVTICGESAGAISIANLLAMPAAKGLFHRAILQSGASGLSPPVLEDSTALIASLGGPDAPVENILAAQDRTIATKGLGAFTPTIDGTSVPRAPLDAVRAGAAAGIPMLLGSNRDEWKLFELILGTERVVAPFKEVLANAFAGRIDELLATYDGSWIHLIGDVAFGIPMIRLAEAQSAHAPVYMYRFDYASTAFAGKLGAAHAIELPLVWNVLELPVAAILLGDPAPARELATAMHASWAAFVRTGDPNVPALPAWPAYASDRATMIFDRASQLVHDPDSARRRAFEGI